MEALESRQLLAVVEWTGLGGDNSWHNDQNWVVLNDLGFPTTEFRTPTAEDDAKIVNPVGGEVVTSEPVTVKSLFSVRPLRVTLGTFQSSAGHQSVVANTVTLTDAGRLAGTWDVDNNPLANGIHVSSLAFLRAAEVFGNIYIGDAAFLRVSDGLRLSGNLEFTSLPPGTSATADRIVYVENSQVWQGGILPCSIIFNDYSYPNTDPEQDPWISKILVGGAIGGSEAVTWTLRPSVIVRGRGDGQIAPYLDTDTTIINEGLIRPDLSVVPIVGDVSRLRIGVDRFENRGVIEAWGDGPDSLRRSTFVGVFGGTSLVNGPTGIIRSLGGTLEVSPGGPGSVLRNEGLMRATDSRYLGAFRGAPGLYVLSNVSNDSESAFLENTGTIESVDGGMAYIGGYWDASVLAFPDLDNPHGIPTVAWTNSGTLRTANGGALTLSGRFETSALTGLETSGGAILLRSAVIDNDGRVLNPDAYGSASWFFDKTRLNRGELRVAVNPVGMFYAGVNATAYEPTTFVGVHVHGPGSIDMGLHPSVAFGDQVIAYAASDDPHNTLRIADGVVLDAVVNVRGTVTTQVVAFDDAQVWSGAGLLRFDGNGSLRIGTEVSAGALTLDSQLRLEVTAGASVTVERAELYDDSLGQSSLANNGSILVTGPGARFDATTFTVSMLNAGTIVAGAGGDIRVKAVITHNTGVMRAREAGVISIEGTLLTNAVDGAILAETGGSVALKALGADNEGLIEARTAGTIEMFHSGLLGVPLTFSNRAGAWVTAIDGGLVILASGVLMNDPGALIAPQIGGTIRIVRDNLENDGTIESEVGTLELAISGTLTNNGTLRAKSGGQLTLLTGFLVNASGGVVEAIDGGVFLLDTNRTAPSWSNLGVFRSVGGTLDLRGRNTPGEFGLLDVSSATVILGGEHDLDGEALPILDPTSTYRLDGGRLSNGTLQIAAGTRLRVSDDPSNTLDAADVSGTIDLDNNGVLRVSGGMALNGVLEITHNATVIADSTQTWSGSGTVIFNGISAFGPGRIQLTSGTSLLVDDIAIHAPSHGQIITASGITFLTLGSSASMTAQGSGGRLDIRPSQLDIATGAMVSAMGGATVAIEPLGWNNDGVIEGADSTLILGGTFEGNDLEGLSRVNSTIVVKGVLDLLNGGIDLDAASGEWIIRNGTIKNGSIIAEGAEAFYVDDIFSRFQFMLFRGDLRWYSDDARLLLDLFFTLDGTAHMDRSGASMLFEGTELFGGNAQVLVTGGGSPRQIGFFGTPGTLTIGSSVTIRGGNTQLGAIIGGSGATSIALSGTLIADQSGQTITNLANTFTVNTAGEITARNGGQAILNGNVTNYGATLGTLTGGAWRVEHGSAIRIPGSDIRINRADITLIGTTSVFENISNLHANEGILTLGGGRAPSFVPVGGLILNAAGATLNVLGPESYATPAGVRFRNDGTIGVLDGALLTIAGPCDNALFGTLVGGTWHVEGNSRLTFSGVSAFSTNAANVRIRGGTSIITGFEGLSVNAGTLELLGGPTYFPRRTAGGTFTNAGTLLLDPTPFTSLQTPSNVSISNSGIIEIGSGTTDLNAPLTHSGGEIRGSGNIRVFSTLVISGGSLAGPGGIEVMSSGTLIFALPESGSYALGRDFVNHGTTIWSGGELRTGDFENHGTVTIAGNGSGFWKSGAGGDPVITNHGVIRMVGLGSRTVELELDNAGLIEVMSGELRLFGGGVHSGDATIAEDATLRIGARFERLTDVDADSTISGPGQLIIGYNAAPTGTNQFGGSINIGGDLTILSDTNAIGGALSVGGDLDVYGGVTDINTTFIDTPGAIRIFGGELWTTQPTITLPVVEVHAGVLGGRVTTGSPSNSMQITSAMLWAGGRIEALSLTVADGITVPASGGTKTLASGLSSGVALTFDGLLWSGGDISLSGRADLVGGTIQKTGGGNVLSPGGTLSRIIADEFLHQSAGATTIAARWSPGPDSHMHVQAGSVTLSNRSDFMTGETLFPSVWTVENGTSLVVTGATIHVNDATVTLKGATSSFPAFNTLSTNNGTVSYLNGRAFNPVPVGGVLVNGFFGVINLGGAINRAPAFAITNYRDGGLAGTVNVLGGSLSLTSSSTGGGIYEITEGAQLFPGSASFTDGAILRGDGLIQFPSFDPGPRTVMSGNVTLAGTNMAMSGIWQTTETTGILVLGTATITGIFNLSGGFVDGTGQLVVGPTGLLNLLPVDLHDRTIVLKVATTNNGVVNLVGGTTANDDLRLAATFTNNAQFVIDTATGSPASMVKYSTSGAGDFLNSSTGVILKYGLAHFGFNLPLTNAGRITVESGSVSYTAGTSTGLIDVYSLGAMYLYSMTLGDGALVQGDGLIQFPSFDPGPRTVMSGNVTLAGTNMAMSGIWQTTETTGILVLGTATITGVFNLSGGFVDGTGQLVVGPTGLLNLLPVDLHDRTIVLKVATTNNGVVNLVGGTTANDDLRLAATFTNNAQFVIDTATGSPASMVKYSTSGAGDFLNSPTGVIRKTGIELFSTDLPLTNHGFIRIEEGSLVYRSGTNHGEISVDSAATAYLFSITLAHGSVVDGDGTVAFPSEWPDQGQTLLTGSVTLAAANMRQTGLSSGAAGFGISIAGTATIKGRFDWYGGHLSGAGTLIVAPEGRLNILPKLDHHIYVNVINNGTIVVTGSASLADAVIAHRPITNAGVLVADSPSGNFQMNFYSVSGSVPFTNTGTIEKRGAGHFWLVRQDGINAMSLNSSGMVRVLQGEFFAPGTQQFLASTISGGSWLITPASGQAANIRWDSPLRTIGTGASVTLDGTGSTFGALNSLDHIDGGSLRLSGGRNFTTASHLTNNGSLNLSTSTLNVSGNYTQTDEAELRLAIAASSHGRLNATGIATLDGDLRVNSPGFLPPLGSEYRLLDAASVVGTFDSAWIAGRSIIYDSSGVTLKWLKSFATSGPLASVEPV